MSNISVLYNCQWHVYQGSALVYQLIVSAAGPRLMETRLGMFYTTAHRKRSEGESLHFSLFSFRAYSVCSWQIHIRRGVAEDYFNSVKFQLLLKRIIYILYRCY